MKRAGVSAIQVAISLLERAANRVLPIAAHECLATGLLVKELAHARR